MSKIECIEKEYLKEVPPFRTGDIVKVHLKVHEGERTRTQLFEGIVIRRHGSGIGASFSVLRDMRGDIVEKTFPLHSPMIEKITVVKKGKARSARLYHLRKKKIGTA